MKLRSLLFVPGDRPERIEKSITAGADAIIIDLEDAVAIEAKPIARSNAADALARYGRTFPIFVRINPLTSGHLAEDLAAARGARAIVLPKSESAACILRLCDAMLEAVPVLPIATETPAAIFGLGSYGDVADRLLGLTWGAEDLPAAIGASTSREADGRYTPPYEMVRSLALFGAHAAGVPAIETIFPGYRDLDGLAAYAKCAARDGFSGMMAIHPTQVPVINAAFTPSPEALVYARRVVAAFGASPHAGVVGLDGKMLDAPHLKQAMRVLARGV
jgi:citrate lyase subunit beta / citryl-CoA lyase